MNNQQNSSEAFDQLVGLKLCAVTYIWDYYQLLIGTEELTVYSHPKVRLDRRWIEHSESGYRDALCERIGAEVLAVSDDDAGMRMEFSDGTTVAISFRPEDRVSGGPESLIWSNPQGALLVVGDSEG